ncbi:MAG: hypothetical protein AAFV87_13750 [Pseudomonadota bacterium]
MSKSIKLLATFSFMVAVAACAREQEEVVVVEPISTEPVQTGKFK